MPLTDTLLRSLKVSDKVQKHSDGGGLYLHIAPTGGKLWRMAYRFEGKQKTLSFGPYPTVSLKDARKKRDDAKEKIAAGIDPGIEKKVAKEAVRAETINSLEVVGREWIEKNKGAWTLDHGKRILARLEKNIFPFLGGKAVDDIKAPELLDALRRIESRDAVYTAHRTLQTCGQIFRYAVATGRAERDISSDLKGALAPAKEVHFASITEPKAVGDLLRTINTYWGHPRIGIALRLAPYLLVRPGELRKAEWAEIDLDAAEWRIPASRMKMRVMHIVPLAGQVIKLLELLQQDTGSGRFLFPSFRAASAPISDATLLAALRNLGYSKDQMTVHGFRSMASTILNEQGYNRDWIERQLAHAESNSVRAAYNYAEYLPERRQMMQEWADYLDKLRENKD